MLRVTLPVGQVGGEGTAAAVKMPVRSHGHKPRSLMISELYS